MSLIFSNVAQVILCMGLAILIFFLLEKPLRALLDQLVGLPSVTTFFTRVLGLVLLLAALKRAVVFISKPDDAWGSIWTVMSNWNEVMEPITAQLLVFAGLMTVLASVLRRRHE